MHMCPGVGCSYGCRGVHGGRDVILEIGLTGFVLDKMGLYADLPSKGTEYER